MLRAAVLAQVLCWAAPPGVRGEYDLLDAQAEHKARAIELDEAGDIAGAIRSFRQAAIFAPDAARSECWNNLGIALMDEENPLGGYGAKAEAAVAFNRAVRADPTNQWAKDNLKDASHELLRGAGIFAGQRGGSAQARQQQLAVDAAGDGGGAAASAKGGSFPFPEQLLPRFHARADWRAGGAADPFAGLFPELLPPRVQGWPFDAVAHLSRADEAPDAAFYAQPRLVTHIDDAAVGALRAFYGAALRQGDDVLEIAASWTSHLPSSFAPTRLAGVGMSASEMRKNAALTEWLVRDLNALPELPFAEQSFDAVLCAVSIDYFTRPRELLRDALRTLRPGGKAVLALSSRFFPSKVIRLWASLNEVGRAWVAGTYLHLAGFEEIAVKDLTPDADGGGDPIFVVTGVRPPS